jgi:hypothetical protein
MSASQPQTLQERPLPLPPRDSEQSCHALRRLSPSASLPGLGLSPSFCIFVISLLCLSLKAPNFPQYRHFALDKVQPRQHRRDQWFRR